MSNQPDFKLQSYPFSGAEFTKVRSFMFCNARRTYEKASKQKACQSKLPASTSG